MIWVNNIQRILEYFTIVGFDKGDSGKSVYDKTEDQGPILSLNIIIAKISFTISLFSSNLVVFISKKT